MLVKILFGEMQDEIAAWRRHLHAHPELGFETHRTAALVAGKLRAFGVDEVTEGVGRTGVVGVIRGRSTASGRVIGLRADMDALPMTEATGAAYASKTPGAMHACGHDGHTAMLLGAAKYLAETRNFDGTAVVIFQPAEEGEGGGRAMVEDGLMERFGIEEVYGMHNWPGRDVGTFAIREGAFFAAADHFEIEVEGKGGHAAKPHETVDTTLVAAHIVTALQSIASRNADPVAQVVVSVTAMRTETDAFNVIPGKVWLKGTVRTLSEPVRDMAEARMKALANATAQAFGAEAMVHYRRNYPVMENAPEPTDFARSVARAVAGGVDEAPVTMGGEDFAFMLNARPGAYILVGNGDTAMVHNPAYDFSDAAIPAGCSYWAELVERRLPAA